MRLSDIRVVYGVTLITWLLCLWVGIFVTEDSQIEVRRVNTEIYEQGRRITVLSELLEQKVRKEIYEGSKR